MQRACQRGTTFVMLQKQHISTGSFLSHCPVTGTTRSRLLLTASGDIRNFSPHDQLASSATYLQQTGSARRFKSYLPHIFLWDVFQPVNFPLCKEFMCTPLSHNLCFLLFLSYEGTRGLSTVFLDLFLHHTLVPRKQIIDTRHHDQCQQCSI